MALLVTLPTLAACASGHVTSREDVLAGVMARLDTSGDGAIDAQEYARVDETGGFAELDRDRDGRIDAGELETWLRVTQPRPDAPFPAATAWLAGGRAPGMAAMVPGAPSPSVAATTPVSPGVPPLVVGVAILVGGLVAGALLGRRRRRRR